MNKVEAICDEFYILRNWKTVFFRTSEQAKKSSDYKKFEDAYLGLSGEKVEKE